MFNAIKTLFNLGGQSSGSKSSASGNSKFVTEPDKIIAMLNQLQHGLLPCSVYIDNSTDKYLTEIIDINLAKKTFTLDELRPADGNALLTRCNSFKCVFLFNGSDVSFTVKPVKNLSPNSTAHVFPIPERIYAPQPQNTKNSIDVQALKIPFEGFSVTNKLPVMGHVVDFTDDGITANLAYNKMLLERGELLKKCHVILPEKKQVVTFDLILDYVNKPSTSNAKTFISGYFENITTKDQLIYEHFFKKLEQEEVKKRNAK